MTTKIDFLFYSPDIVPQQALNANDSLHCIRVLRKSKGDTLHVTDGVGNLFKVVVTDANVKACKFEIVEKTEFQPPARKVHLAICPTKNADRMEYLVEKCTEIGVESIHFVLSQNTYPKKVNMERMNKIAASAMKQSLKVFLPQLFEPMPFSKFISSQIQPFSQFIAHLSDFSTDITRVPMQGEMLVLIGPEGDFSKAEIDLAVENNYKAVFMGQSRLRTETAGVLAVSMLNLLP
jgi:16S rRNA (uracil1498-N3)-methyltransferase